ncbi:hypothetical protein LMG27174_07146 [Paraburkholderia rhynchosiae]|uniref:Uncharacterized protein n=1 Tax=Paraburkholderia rhynchosiae TaxID=487049 RepID=A0A6J5CU57_9BURK|nr:hypothetical protein LMG27174_07146 [Paraburkholderia rhynchosiae]
MDGSNHILGLDAVDQLIELPYKILGIEIGIFDPEYEISSVEVKRVHSRFTTHHRFFSTMLLFCEWHSYF